MGTSKKRVYALNELLDLVGKDHACITVKECNRKLALHPKYVVDVKKGIKETLDLGLNKFDRSLGGILFGYRRLKILNDKNSGKIVGKFGEFQITVIAEFFVFQPEIGSILEGTVNVKSDNHIGCLIHNMINATILKPSDVEYESWNCRNIQIGSVIRLEVVDLSFHGHVPYIEGKIPGQREKTKCAEKLVRPGPEESHQVGNTNLNAIDLIKQAESNEDFQFKLPDSDANESVASNKTVKATRVPKEKESKKQEGRKRQRKDVEDESPSESHAHTPKVNPPTPAKKKCDPSLVFNSSERSLFSDSEGEEYATVRADVVNGFSGGHPATLLPVKRSRPSGGPPSTGDASPSKKKRSKKENRGESEVDSASRGNASPNLLAGSGRNVISETLVTPSKKKKSKTKRDRGKERLSLDNAMGEQVGEGKCGVGGDAVLDVSDAGKVEGSPKKKSKKDRLTVGESNVTSTPLKTNVEAKKSKKDRLTVGDSSETSTPSKAKVKKKKPKDRLTFGGLNAASTPSKTNAEKKKSRKDSLTDGDVDTMSQTPSNAHVQTTKSMITSTPKVKSTSNLSSEGVKKKVKKSDKKDKGNAKKSVIQNEEFDSIRTALLNEIKHNLYS